MKFYETPLKGSYVVETVPFRDDRGSFSRVFCAEYFRKQDLEHNFVQANFSTNISSGTLRGMHYQKPPHEEVKLIQCTQGAIFDVIVDLRIESPTYLKWFGTELTLDNGLMLYVPKGFAHGYQTLSDKSSIHYMVSQFYTPGSEYGLYYADPSINIEWPKSISNISEKDASWPLINAGS
jgi:dTDP-4-dehydrorhamnose 3,5-epimerase